MEQINENYAPKKNKRLVEKDIVFRLASIMCTNDEIAAVLNTSPTTIRTKYKKQLELGRAEGKKSLRRAQFEAAIEKKDVRMLMFLGRNYLGQSDTGENTEDNKPLPWLEQEGDDK